MIKDAVKTLEMKISLVSEKLRLEPLLQSSDLTAKEKQEIANQISDINLELGKFQVKDK